MDERVAVPCRICHGVIDFDFPALGLEIECPDCGEAFRVISLDPLCLNYALDADEEVAGDADTHPRSAGSEASP